MRLATLILLFVTQALAQATQPMTFQQLQSGEWQGKNITSKEILAYVVEFESTHTRFAHDYYFKRQGIIPNGLEDFELPPLPRLQKEPPIPMTGGKVLWVQFVDGTEWGEHALGEKLLSIRQPMLHLISQMIDAYGRGGEEGFSQYLATAKTSADATESGFATHIWIMQQQSGTEGAVGHLKVRLQSAAKHDKTLLESK
jgi:hypothetical protein